MQHAELSDTALMELARTGSAPAFAVLVHRHGPAVRTVTGADKDPTGAVVDTFVAAMRQLRNRSADQPVRPWLLGLAADQVREPVTTGVGQAPRLDPDELDEIWAELDLRWPDGRVRRSLPRWVGWTLLVIALASLAVLVPYLTLTVGENGEEASAELPNVVARPFEEEMEPPAEEPDELEALEPPPFEFPDVDLEPDPPPTPQPSPEPLPPTPEPAPEPEPEPDPEPQPEPEGDA